MPLKTELRKLAREGEVITVRNNEKTMTIFSMGPSDPDYVEWHGAGDPNGKDIQEVPATYLRSSDFLRAISSGILDVIDAEDPEVLAAMQAQSEDWKARQEQKHNAAEILVAQTPSAQAFSCIAPVGGNICGDLTTMSGNSVSERPPLCAKHAGMRNQFVSEQTGRYVNNKPEVTWTFAQLAH